MKYKLRRVIYLSILLFPAFACQMFDNLLDGSPDSRKETVAVATQLPTQVLDAPSADSNAIEAASATLANDVNSPPPLPPIISPAEEELEGADSIVFESGAGYSFTYPNGWAVSDYFGQTIAANDPAVFDAAELMSGQLLLLVTAGTVGTNGPSVEQIMVTVQEDLLAGYLVEGRLSQLSAFDLSNQRGSSGIESTYLLETNDAKNLFVHTISLIRGDLYVVAIGLVPEEDQQLQEQVLIQVLESVELTADHYLADAADYGLTQPELKGLDGELTSGLELPDPLKVIEFGETIAVVGRDGVVVLQFSAVADTSITLLLTPNNAGFDPAFDVIDSNNESILADGKVDDGLAGEAESADLKIPATGNYRIVIRGFGFSGGEFELQLDVAE